ncbi:MAG: hypothetical protein AAF333_15245 [Planctomycetota bacterium]
MSEAIAPRRPIVSVVGAVFPWAAVLLGAWPTACYLAAWIDATRARQHLGRWPSYGRPDPAYLPDGVLWFDTMQISFSFLLLTSGVAAFVWLVLRMLAETEKRWKFAIVFGLAAWPTVFTLAFIFDPGGVVDWRLD